MVLLKGSVVLLGEMSAGIDLRAHFCIFAVLCGLQGDKSVIIVVRIASWLGTMCVTVHSVVFFYHGGGWRERFMLILLEKVTPFFAVSFA